MKQRVSDMSVQSSLAVSGLFCLTAVFAVASGHPYVGLALMGVAGGRAGVATVEYLRHPWVRP